MVRTHPETGRRTLFVNSAFTQHIVGLDPDESAELLEYLYRQAAYPEYQCRFHWAPGEVVFWDNRATQHYAVSDYFPQRRVMERVSILGTAPTEARLTIPRKRAAGTGRSLSRAAQRLLEELVPLLVVDVVAARGRAARLHPADPA